MKTYSLRAKFNAKMQWFFFFSIHMGYKIINNSIFSFGENMRM